QVDDLEGRDLRVSSLVRFHLPGLACDGESRCAHLDRSCCARHMGKREPPNGIRFSRRVKGIASQVDRRLCNRGTARIADDPLHLRCLRGHRKSQSCEKQGQNEDEGWSAVQHRSDKLTTTYFS